jgi:hypothetical protein
MILKNLEKSKIDQALALLKGFHSKAGKEAFLKEKVDPDIRVHIMQKFPKILEDDEVYGSPLKKLKQEKRQEFEEGKKE